MTAVLNSYLDQLKKLSEETGWNLKEACIDAGLALTTYQRWINGDTDPRFKQADKVANWMLQYRRN